MNYRASEHGKAKRREQAARYRDRCKERRASESSQQSTIPNSPSTGSTTSTIRTTSAPSNSQPTASSSFPSDDPAVLHEGYHKDESREKTGCGRPGCYKRFTPPPRSPLQKFCCSRCRKALRTVVLREQRWLQWLSGEQIRARDGPP